MMTLDPYLPKTIIKKVYTTFPPGGPYCPFSSGLFPVFIGKTSRMCKLLEEYPKANDTICKHGLRFLIDNPSEIVQEQIVVAGSF